LTPPPADSALAVTPGPAGLLDEESRAWLHDLRAQGPAHLAAVGRLHELLLRAARFEVARRRPGLAHLRGDELGEIALEAADDALMSVLARLDDFRGASRFTTWVYKFALLEAAVKLRKRAWQGRCSGRDPTSPARSGSRGPARRVCAASRQLRGARTCTPRS
jgi:RNA polymerase sigma-70 factor (ECF subfamily)